MQIKDAATIVGRVHARLKDAAGPMTVRQLSESLGVGRAAVQYAAKALNARGIARKVPYRPLDGVGSERHGWEYAGLRAVNTSPTIPVEKLEEKQDLRVKVNEDHSVTIITAKVRITIELPE